VREGLVEFFVALFVGWLIWRILRYSDSKNNAKRDQWSLLVRSASLPFTTPSSKLPFLDAIQEAAAQRRRVWLKYVDSESRITERKVEIYRPEDKIYLFAWCCLRNEPRTFKIGNILEWKVLDEHFEYNVLVDQYVQQQLLGKDWNNKTSWLIWSKSISSPDPPGVSPTIQTSPTQKAHVTAASTCNSEESYWIPSEKSISICGYKIPSAGIFVGSGLRAMNGLKTVEPALIDPRLSIDKSRADRTGKNVPYWPSYSELSPASRAGYLAWLSTARQDARVHIGYPFLFLYGLERRLLASGNPLSHDKSELEFMTKELQRLLSLYGTIASFRRYAASFLEIIQVSQGIDNPSKTIPPVVRIGDTLPASLQVGICEFANSDRPFPADWALSWVLCHPEVQLRAPARRCHRELRELFALRYGQEFGVGVKERCGKDRLSLRYKPASPTFGQDMVISIPLFDVTALRSVPRKLVDLVERCTDELEPYSRRLATKGEDELAKVALLPAELTARCQGRACLELQDWLNQQLGPRSSTTVLSRELLGHWRGNTEERLSKHESVLLAQLLAKLGYGVEPDPRFGGPALEMDGKAVVFRISHDWPSAPSPEYGAATILIHAGVIVAMADGVFSSEEERRLRDYLRATLRIGEFEQQRLAAHLGWLNTKPPSLSSLSKRLELLDQGQKRNLAQFLVTLCGADGHITSEEVEALTKVYSILGFQAERLFRDIDQLGPTNHESDSDALATVRPAGPARSDYRLPTTAGKDKHKFSLDMTKVNEKLAETASVSALLGSIFIDEEPATTVPSGVKMFGALDSRYSPFLVALVNKEIWDRAAIEQLASTMKLLPDGALDAINEAAFETVGEALWEGDDPIQVNISIAKEMMTCQMR